MPLVAVNVTVVPALATGQVDAVGGAFGPEMINAIERGVMFWTCILAAGSCAAMEAAS